MTASDQDGGLLADFHVSGRPRTKGSLRAYCRKDGRHTVRLEEEVEQSKVWRRMVGLGAQKDMMARHGRLLKYDGPVQIRALFLFLPGEHVTPFPTHIQIGDTDKLARNVGDALVDAGMINDDSLVTDFMAAKRWGKMQGVRIWVHRSALPGSAPVWMTS